MPAHNRAHRSRRYAAAALALALAATAAGAIALERPGKPEPGAAAAGIVPGAGRCHPPFGAGRWPGACWRPYSARSPFNRRLPPKPPLHPGSAAMVARLTADGGPSPLRLGTADTSSDWDHPVYWARRSDPVFRIHCTNRAWGRCEVEGRRVRVPRRARRAAGGDGHLAIVDPARRWEYDLYQVSSKRRGRLLAHWGGRTRLNRRSKGLGSDATAAHFGLLAGIVRAPELAAGRIEHALFVRIDCDGGYAVWPAHGRGARCEDPAGAPPEGARFQLAMSDAEIDALGAPRWKRAILRAMAHYGFFVGDTGGSPWDVVLESGSTYTSFGYRDPWRAIGRRAGGEHSDGIYHLDLASGVDWAGRLRVIAPCVSRGTCGGGR